VIDDWQLDPRVLAAAALALVLFAQACRRLRRRGRADLAGWSRAGLFVLGIAIATLALVSPLDPIGEDYLLSGHMLQHVLIGDLAPALLVVALRGPLLVFVLPREVLRPLGHRQMPRRVVAYLLRPRVSFAVWALGIGLWHIPAAYDYALDHQLVHNLEHLTFMLGGLLAWAQLVDPARRRALDPHGRLVCAASMVVAAQALAAVLVLSSGPLYSSYAAEPHRLLGLSPLHDQQLAGALMVVEQMMSVGVFATVLLARRTRVRISLARRTLVRAVPDPDPRW
jgi:cytochrome c oxidase assembly factor CtaG